MALKSQVQWVGGGAGTTIPRAAARGMELEVGDELYWVPDPAGGYHVFPARALRLRASSAHQIVMAEYGEVFAALAR